MSPSVPSLLSVLLIIQDLEEILDLKGKHRVLLAAVQVWALPHARMPRGPGHEDAPLPKGITRLTRGRRPVSPKLVLEGFAVLFHSVWNTGNLASCNNNHSSTKLKNKDDVRFETQAMKKLASCFDPGFSQSII